MILFDDYGWANAGWHRDYTIGGVVVPYTKEVQTPHLNALVKQGIEFDRHYVYKYCSPSRSALQSGRNPYHVNPLNADASIANHADPVSGFAGVPRNMTGIASKMAAAGYRTAMYGKWDAGMATPDHTPHGRGYQHTLSYFHHCNDFWSMTDAAQICKPHINVDLWRAGLTSGGGAEGPAYHMNNTCVRKEGCFHPIELGQPKECQAGTEGDTWWGGYEDSLFEQQVLHTIDTHNTTSDGPLFLFWAPHIVHAPLQLPQVYIEKFDFMAPTDKPTHQRQVYHAMVNFADDMVNNVTSLYKAKGMYDDLLIIFSADNGGPIYARGSGGANNYPLRGGKMNNWEGGIRANAFASGGWLPPHVRGTKFTGLIALWDWYSTFAHLAGVDPTDHRAAKANLPPIDSYDLSHILLGLNTSSPRLELPIGTEPRASNITTAPLCSSYDHTTVYYEDPNIEGDEIDPIPSTGRCTTVSGLILDERVGGDGDGALWKLLTGPLQQAVYLGPHWPNGSSSVDSFDHKYDVQCGNGCLYELVSDPFETNDLAKARPEKVAELMKKVTAYEATAFNPKRGGTDPLSCQAAVRNGGFWGPFLP